MGKVLLPQFAPEELTAAYFQLKAGQIWGQHAVALYFLSDVDVHDPFVRRKR